MTHRAAEQDLRQRLGELPWRKVLPWAVGAAVVLATALGALLHGAGLAILVLAAAVLLTAIGALWTSVRALVGELPMDVEDAYALAAPAGADDQKRALLRALEDLDYEKRVGKISEQDFGELGARYRSEAKQLLGVEGAARAEERRAVERLVADHLAGLGLAPEPSSAQDGEPAATPSSDGAEPAEDDASDAGAAAADTTEGAGSDRAEPVAAGPDASAGDVRGAPTPTDPQPGRIAASSARKKRCSACGAKNDPDAQFCKKCGLRIDPHAARARGRGSHRGGKRRS